MNETSTHCTHSVKCTITLSVVQQHQHLLQQQQQQQQWEAGSNAEEQQQDDVPLWCGASEVSPGGGGEGE